MSQYNGRKKRAFFTKRNHGGNGTPKFMSESMKRAIDQLRNHDPVRYQMLTTRITKRGRKQHCPAF